MVRLTTDHLLTFKKTAMKNLTTSSLKTLLLVLFCSASFFTSSAQRRSESPRQPGINGDRNFERPGQRGPGIQQPRPNIQREGRLPQRGSNPRVYSDRRFPPRTVVRPAPRPYQTPRNYRNERIRVAARPGFGYYNNAYRHHYYGSPVYSAYNPCWRYTYFPPRRTIITSFPFAFQTIRFGGLGYRFYDGTFYRPYNSSFMVVAPPIGIFINVLPFGYRRIVVNDYPYYYYNGTYYDQDYDNNGYKVVAPPVGAVVESIPPGYEKITIDGETYYKIDDVQYKPVVQDNGEIWYQVIKVG